MDEICIEAAKRIIDGVLSNEEALLVSGLSYGKEDTPYYDMSSINDLDEAFDEGVKTFVFEGVTSAAPELLERAGFSRESNAYLSIYQVIIDIEMITLRFYLHQSLESINAEFKSELPNDLMALVGDFVVATPATIINDAYRVIPKDVENDQINHYPANEAGQMGVYFRQVNRNGDVSNNPILQQLANNWMF